MRRSERDVIFKTQPLSTRASGLNQSSLVVLEPTAVGSRGRLALGDDENTSQIYVQTNNTLITNDPLRSVIDFSMQMKPANRLTEITPWQSMGMVKGM